MDNNTMSGASNFSGIAGQDTMAPQGTMPVAPKKKKTGLILGLSLGIGGIVIVIVVVVVVIMMSKVDYGEAYRVASELSEKVQGIHNDYDCTNVVDDYDDEYVSDKTFDGYVVECEATTEGVDELVKKLGETAGVKKNKEIKEKYEVFSEEMVKIVPEGDELGQKLAVYQAWHTFAVKVDDLQATSADAAVQAAANVLIESGNEVLKKYGEGWLEKTLAYTHAFQVYRNTSWSASNYNDVVAARDDAKTAQENYSMENKPDIGTLAGLNFDNTTKMYNAFEEMRELINREYEANYDYESGDCFELFGEVVCD